VERLATLGVAWRADARTTASAERTQDRGSLIAIGRRYATHSRRREDQKTQTSDRGSGALATLGRHNWRQECRRATHPPPPLCHIKELITHRSMIRTVIYY